MAQDEKTPVFTERTRFSLLQRRILVLDGVLDDDNGTLLATQLLTLADEDTDADVALWINSPGGSVPSMLAIRDIMRLVPCDVSTLALGIAYSAGQFLLSAGTKGKRFALPHARILMHQGSAGIGGSAVEVELQAADLRQTCEAGLKHASTWREVAAWKRSSETKSASTATSSGTRTGTARSSRSMGTRGNRRTWCGSTTVIPGWCIPGLTR